METRQVPTGARRSVVRRPGVTLYSEVARGLSDRIAHGEFVHGDKLPSEAELAQDYGVNRLTVRRALSELALANLIRTEHGVGSFVREPAVRHRVDDGHAGLAESMAARGLEVTHQLISTDTVDRSDLDEEIQQRLPDRWTGPLVRFRYRRLLEGIPWSLSVAIVPAELAPQTWTGDASLTAILADLGLPLERAERGFSAGAAGDEEAGWLDVESGSPVLVVRGLNVDHDGVPVMFLQHHTRADRAEYVIRLTPYPNEGK